MTGHEPRDDKTETYHLFSAGTTVGQYTIEEKIASGGMGEVYLARDTKLNRKLALKFLPQRFMDDEAAKARFSREAQATARLSHPSIVTIHEVGEYQNRPYIAMEYIVGPTLHQYAHEEPQPIEDVLDIIAQAADGLAKAHSEGITHRDIKAKNIMLDADGRPKILDFGLATIEGTERLTRAGVTVGTAAYMAPEQAQGKKADERSDLFSLGIVLYELIAGRTPFRKDSETATVQAILTETAEPLARFKAAVPEGVQRIIDKLLEKDPAMRYQTAADLRADLLREKRLLESGISSDISRVAAGIRVPTKNRVRNILLSAGALVAIIAIALILRPWQVEVKPTQTAEAAENRLAILYFENLADPTDSLRLGEIVANLLITGMTDAKGLSVLSSQRLYDILKQLGKEGERQIDRQTATQVAQRANASWMMVGSILQTAPRIIITTQVIDVTSGQVEASQRSTGEEGEDIFVLVDRLTDELREDLSVPASAVSAGGKNLADAMTHSQEAYRLYLEGIEFANKMYRKEAKERFLRAIEIDSTFAMAYFRLSIPNRTVQTDEQKEYIRKAMRYSDQVNQLQRMYILARADEVAGDLDAAIATLEQLVAKYPEEKLAHMALADLYGRQKLEVETGLEYLERVLEIDPLDRTALNMMAYACKDLRQYDKALEMIDRYIAVVPDEPNPYDSRAEIAAAAGKLDLAANSYREALRKDSGFENALKGLAVVELERGNYAAADSCIRVLLNDPDPEVRVLGRFFLALPYQYRGQLAEVCRVLEEGIVADRLEQVTKSSYGGLEKLAVESHVLRQRGMYDSALIVLDEVSFLHRQKYPDDPMRYSDVKAVLLACTGDFQEATKILQRLEPVISNADDVGLRASFAQASAEVAMEEGDYQRAIAILTDAQAFAVRMWRPRAEYLLAQAYLGAGQPAKAILYLERFTSTIENIFWPSPFDAVSAHYYLGIAYEETGRKEDAIREYETFLKRWQDADEGLMGLEDARQRLANLRKTA